MAAQLEDAPAAALAPPPSYASLASPLVPQTAFEDQPRYDDDEVPVHPAFDHAYGQSLNLPRGFFLIRNAAQGKALDLLQHRQNEGAELGLHPVKQPQLQGVSLQHTGNNQLFALSWDGHLFSAAASREIGVDDNRLVLAFPHPITKYPSPLSHAPPRFRLDPSTSTLHVIYSHDPSFLGPDDSSDWREDDYIVEAVPLRRKPAEPTLWSTTQANQLLSAVGSRAANLGARVGGLLGRRFSQPASPNPSGGSGSVNEPDLPPPPPPEKEVEKDVPPVPSTSELPDLPRTPSPASSSVAATAGTDDDSCTPLEEESDSDSEPSAFRPVRVVRLAPNWRDKFPSAALRAAPNTSFGVTRWPASAKELRKWRRRQWDVVPVTVQPLPAPEGFLVPSPAGSDSAPRSRSDSVSLFDSGGEGAAATTGGSTGESELIGSAGGEVYDPAGNDDDAAAADAAEIDSRDFSPLGIASPAGDLVNADLPALPAAAAASQIPGLLGGATRLGSSSGGSSGRESPLPPAAAPASKVRPLPPSPPLPSVPFAAAAPVGTADDAGADFWTTPRPEDGDVAHAETSGLSDSTGERTDASAPNYAEVERSVGENAERDETRSAEPSAAAVNDGRDPTDARAAALAGAEDRQQDQPLDASADAPDAALPASKVDIDAAATEGVAMLSSGAGVTDEEALEEQQEGNDSIQAGSASE
ncbi:hypothetical protein JCM3770_004875 [Rhodotorula araucariae]